MAEGPVIVLPSGQGRSFIETGLVVLRDTYNRLFPAQPSAGEDALLASIAVHHEWVHYLQSITCAAVNYQAQRLLEISFAIVENAARGAVPDAAHTEMVELRTLLYGRISDESIRIIDRPEGVIFYPIPDSDQLGMLDLMEGVAVLESFKLCAGDPGVGAFLFFLERHFSLSIKNVYRRSFDWLADAIGPEGAYDLLAPVSFFALQTSDPPSAFALKMKRLKKMGPADYRALRRRDALSAALGMPDGSDWLEAYAQEEPEGDHGHLDKCIRSAVAGLGTTTLRDLGAMPSQVTADSIPFVRPPVTVFSGQDGIQYLTAPHAAKSLVDDVFRWTAVVGAAERLTVQAETDVYQFCPHHDSCPHFESALCHRFFVPPKPALSHKSCAFPALLEAVTRLEPSALWAKVGHARISAADLVNEFEGVGEAAILALVRRRRQAIIALAGADGYTDLEWKAEATANKTMRALQTQKINDLIEARAYRDAVVRELSRRVKPD